ncbi:MAG: TonB-dependent receptor [Geobacteraceae bacterium]|nr:TonB-dependent receptor [Geobacteraceae bacterium]
MVMMTRAGLLLLCAGLLTASPGFAEEAATNEGYESYSLGEVYIKGEKPPVVKETTVTTVITAEDIKNTNSNTVSEALSHATGVRVSTGTKNVPTVSIRGFFDQNRVLVLIDGVPYYETKYGGLDLNQLTTDNVSKIEITKGAASVLYGANAMGGVINIVTKQASGKPTFSLNVEGGEVDYYKASLNHGMKKGIFNYWLSYTHQQSNGWRMSDDFRPRTGSIVTSGKVVRTGVFEDGGTRNQSDYSSDSIWAKFGITPSEGSEYSLNFNYTMKDHGNPPSLDSVRVMPNRPAFANFFRYNQYDDWNIDLSGQQKLGDKVTLKGKLFYHNHVDGLDSYSDETFSKIISRSNYHDYMIGGSLITEWKPVSWNTARFVFNYRGDSHKQRDDNYLPYETYWAFTGSTGIEDEITIAKNFSVIVGGSYDWFKVTDANKNNTDKKTGDFVNQTALPTGPAATDFNPMIGATYTFPDKTKLFTSVARKSRFPTLDQLYSSRSGNIDLKPEHAINSTIGVSRSFSDFMWGELAFFYSQINDFIMRPDPDGTNENIGKVELYGIELSTEIYPAKDLILKLGYNFNQASDQSDNKVTDHVRNVPEHKLDLGLQYTVPYTKTRLNLNGLLMASLYSQVPTPDAPQTKEIETAGFFTMDLRLTQPFLKNFEAYLAINNLFDKNYEPESGFPAPGRNIFGGITAKF